MQRNIPGSSQRNIPVLYVRGSSIAEAWENSIEELYKNGIRIKTQYDKPEDPPSIDSTMIITIDNPLSEPMIHKEMPCGLEDLKEYTMEVCDGIKDHLVRDQKDPNDKRWQYTYHQRMFSYNYIGIDTVSGGNDGRSDVPEQRTINQIDLMCKKIAECPYTRRAQAVTWKVWEDNECDDPACWQSLWGRCIEDNGELWLNTNIRFRSNDAFKAAQLNMFAIIQLIKIMAERISVLSGKKVNVGRYVHMADSYHLYGSYFKEFDARWKKGMLERTFGERTMRYCDVKDIMDESIPIIMDKMKTFGK